MVFMHPLNCRSIHGKVVPGKGASRSSQDLCEPVSHQKYPCGLVRFQGVTHTELVDWRLWTCPYSTEYVSQTSPNSTTAGMGKRHICHVFMCSSRRPSRFSSSILWGMVAPCGSTWSEAFGWKAQCENTWLAKLLANVSCYEILKVRHGTGSSVGFSVFLHPSSLLRAAGVPGGSIAASSRKRGGEHELGLSDLVDVSGTFGTSMWWVQWSNEVDTPVFCANLFLFQELHHIMCSSKGRKLYKTILVRAVGGVVCHVMPCQSWGIGGWLQDIALAALFPSQTGCGERKAYKKAGWIRHITGP